MKEPNAYTDEVARQVIGAAIEVHRILGPGFLESTYEAALYIELQQRGIDAQRQHPVSLTYKGHPIGEGRLDLLVEGCLIVELKAVEKLIAIHMAQVLSYLKATNLELGLLINFNVPVLKQGIRRVANTK